MIRAPARSCLSLTDKDVSSPCSQLFYKYSIPSIYSSILPCVSFPSTRLRERQQTDVFLTETERRTKWLDELRSGKKKGKDRGSVMESDNRNCWISRFLRLGWFQLSFLATPSLPSPGANGALLPPSSAGDWVAKLLPSPGLSPSLSSQSF